jgi:hypothetical protein
MMLMALLSLASGVPLLHLAGYVVGRWPDLIGPASRGQGVRGAGPESRAVRADVHGHHRPLIGQVEQLLAAPAGISREPTALDRRSLSDCESSGIRG